MSKTLSHISKGAFLAKTAIMASKYNKPILEGVFAIHKPPAITSAQVIRDVQRHFTPSTLFRPWVDREQSRRDAESHNQKSKRRSWRSRQQLQVKIGHGGTLDPMATGVLILGIGSGTKSLNSFLECTKSYETVVVFGTASDSYDTQGQLVACGSYEHITPEKVEAALGRFKGKIMQKPPIFSALRVQGKRLYEYAREGKEVPVEIRERPVEVEKLEVIEWYPGGTHQWRWPRKAAESEEKEVVEKILHIGDAGNEAQDHGDGDAVTKKRRLSGEEYSGRPSPKRSKLDHNFDDPMPSDPEPNSDLAEQTPTTDASAASTKTTTAKEAETSYKVPCPAPAVRLRMTVTSGFYVRSLCHDLGIALDSLGIMASLVRSRQGEFELGNNVLPYEDLAKGENEWGPKVDRMLKDWNARQKEKVYQNDAASGRRTEGDGKRDIVPEGGGKAVAGEAKSTTRVRARRNTSSPESD